MSWFPKQCFVFFNVIFVVAFVGGVSVNVAPQEPCVLQASAIKLIEKREIECTLKRESVQ